MIKKIIITMLLTVCLFSTSSTVRANSAGDITGDFIGVSDAVWGQDVVYNIDTTPDIHNVKAGRWNVDDLYITTVCLQNDVMVIQTSIHVGGDGSWTLPILGQWTIAELDTSLPGHCEAWLIHTNIKGKNHQIDPLDKIWYDVAPAP